MKTAISRIRFLAFIIAFLFVLSLLSASDPVSAPPAGVPGAPPDGMPTPIAFPPLVRSDRCETHVAAMSLTASATVLHVGEVVNLTATLTNVGCTDLGMPQYRLHVWPEAEQPMFEPNPRVPILHLLGVHPGQSDAATYVLQAVASGEATISAAVSFEVHLGYPGPAYWGASSSDPLTITVMSAVAPASPTPCFATATPTPAMPRDTTTPTPTPAVAIATATSTPTPATARDTTTPTPTPATAGVTPTLSVTPVQAPGSLMVHKMAMPDAIAPGELITYIIVMMNDQLGRADPGTAVVLTDTIPAHTSYISGTADSGAQYDAAADSITWTGAVPQGLSVEVSFQVRVDDAASLTGVPSSGEIENVVLVTDAFGRVYERRSSVSVHVPADAPVPTGTLSSTP